MSGKFPTTPLRFGFVANSPVVGLRAALKYALNSPADVIGASVGSAPNAAYRKKSSNPAQNIKKVPPANAASLIILDVPVLDSKSCIKGIESFRRTPGSAQLPVAGVSSCPKAMAPYSEII